MASTRIKLTSVPVPVTSGKMKPIYNILKFHFTSIKKSLGNDREALDEGTEIKKRRNFKKISRFEGGSKENDITFLKIAIIRMLEHIYMCRYLSRYKY